MNLLGRNWTDDDGQDLIEYGLIALLISTAIIAAVEAFGAAANELWSRICAGLSA